MHSTSPEHTPASSHAHFSGHGKYSKTYTLASWLLPKETARVEQLRKQRHSHEHIPAEPATSKTPSETVVSDPTTEAKDNPALSQQASDQNPAKEELNATSHDQENVPAPTSETSGEPEAKVEAKKTHAATPESTSGQSHQHTHHNHHHHHHHRHHHHHSHSHSTSSSPTHSDSHPSLPSHHPQDQNSEPQS